VSANQGFRWWPVTVADTKILKREGRKNIFSALSSFIANAHNEIYAFYMEKSHFLRKKYEPMGRRPPFEYATGQ